MDNLYQCKNPKCASNDRPEPFFLWENQLLVLPTGTKKCPYCRDNVWLLEKPRPSMEGQRVIQLIDVNLHDITMDEAWQKLKTLIPAGDSFLIDPIPFKSAKPGKQTLPKLYWQKYREPINERLCREVVKWAQAHGELLITSMGGVRYAVTKDEYHDWARTQLRHAFTILEFWRKVAPHLAQEIEGQLDAYKPKA